MPSITIRDVPEETRAELAARASRGGRSMQEYLRSQLIALASRPDRDDVLDRIRAQVAEEGTTLGVDFILEARDADRR